MNRYETNSKGTSPALSALNNSQTKQPRSAFDLSRRKSFDASPFAIIPIEVFPMLPNSELYLTYDVQAISKNPMIRRILSSMSVELRTYYVKNSDCWEGWNNFITKGRSGKLDLKIPTLDYVHNSNKHTSFPYNPYAYLNIAPPIKYDDSQSFELNQGINYSRTEVIDGITVEHIKDTGLTGSINLATNNCYTKGQSALPAVMYCKIAKQYQNANLLQENKSWYPENENHDLILPYNCTHATTASYDYPNVKIGDVVETITQSKIQPTNDKESKPWLNVLYYRQRKGNQFNTGSPFPDLLRGDMPTLDINTSLDFSDFLMSTNGNTLNFLPAFGGGNGTHPAKLGALRVPGTDSANGFLYGFDGNYGTQKYIINSDNLFQKSGNAGSAYVDKSDLMANALAMIKINPVNFTLNNWRKLATLTVFRERMARTDGSYNEMIQAQFSYNPRWHEHDVVYCGGSYQPIVFSEVVQTSEDGGTPLGTTAGRAVTAKTGSNIVVKSNDYGMVMTVMTIVPDDYYSQGINRIWSNLDQSTQYFPIMNNLEPTAIKNKELFVSGNDVTDEDVFTYQELFFEYKSRLNEISGLMSLPIEKVGETGAYIFNRLFNATPSFNNAFVTGKMTDNENLCFASTEQAQFIFSVASMAKFVAPLPAVSQPSDMGISY